MHCFTYERTLAGKLTFENEYRKALPLLLKKRERCND